VHPVRGGARGAQASADRWTRAQSLLLPLVEALEVVRQSSYQPNLARRWADRAAAAQARSRCRRQVVTSPAWVEAVEAQESVVEPIPAAA
jgi:hypothetical protein